MKILRKKFYLKLNGEGFRIPALPETASSGFTWSAWIQAQPNHREDTLMLWSPAQKGFTIHWQQSALHIKTEDTVYSSELSVPEGHWVFVSVVYDPQRPEAALRFYVNAEPAGEHVVSQELGLPASEVTIGDGFSGGLAAVGLWQEARSVWKLLQDLGNLHRHIDHSLVAVWPLEEGEGQLIKALGPHKLEAQLKTGTWVVAEKSIFIRPQKHKMRKHTIPLRRVELIDKGEAEEEPYTLPESGRNGEATKFLSRTDAYVSNTVAYAQETTDKQVQLTAEIGALQVQQAEREAAKIYNSGRFDRMWFIYQSKIHYTDPQGQIQLYVGDNHPQGFLAIDLAIDSLANKLFWITRANSYCQVMSADISTGSLSELVESKQEGYLSLTLDTTNQRVYYLTNAGEILRIDYTRKNSSTIAQNLNGLTKDGLWQLDFNPVDNFLYWTNDYSICKISTQGDNQALVISNHESPYPLDLKVNPEEGKLYWVDKELGVVRRANLDGTQPESLFSAPQVSRGMALDYVAPDLKDLLEQEVYWINRDTRIFAQTPGIVGTWPLDESEGFKIHNTIHPLATVPLGLSRENTDLPANLSGSSFALRFKGSSLAQIPNRYTEPLTEHSFTICMWIKPGALDPNGRSMGLLAAGLVKKRNNQLHLTLYRGKAKMSFWDNDLYGTIPLNAHQWVHLAFRYTYDPTKQSGQQAIFVNGQFDSSKENSTPLTVNLDRHMYLGVYYPANGDTKFYTGLMADLRILPQSLSKPSIQQVMLNHEATPLMDDVISNPFWAPEATPPTLTPMAASLSFNGVSQYQTLGTASQLKLTGGSFTVEIWVLPTKKSLNNSTILGVQAGADKGLSLILKEEKLSFTYLGNTLNGTLTLSENKWTHVAARYDQSTEEYSLFLNGQKDQTRTYSSKNKIPAGDVYLARKENVVSYEGLMSNVRLWETPRTDGAITQNLRQYQESYVMRGPISGNGSPERIFQVPVEGGLALVSKEQEAYAERTQAQQMKQENQNLANALVQEAGTEKNAQIQSKTDELTSTHTLMQQEITAERIRLRDDRQANQNTLVQAQNEAQQKIQLATDRAADNLDTGQQEAVALVADAKRQANMMKENAKNERDEAQADVNEKKTQL